MPSGEAMIDWAVVAATIVGPIAAVAISMKMEERRSRRARKHWVFSTLMGLRGVPVSPEHVRAINLVQVEFHDRIRVIEAWRKFLAHAETNAAQSGWNIKYRDLLNDLLVQIAGSLDINAEAIDIARGGYYPLGWADQANDETAIRSAAAKLAKFLTAPEFDAWMERLKDADYRVQLAKAVNEMNSRPAPNGSGIGQ